MESNPAITALQHLDETIGPLLHPLGFAKAQIAHSGRTAAAIYCASLTDIRLGFPDLLDGHEESPQPGACFDVTVESHDELLTKVFTDGGELDDQLRHIGREDQTDHYLPLLDNPAAEVRDDITGLLATVFGPRLVDANPAPTMRFLDSSWLVDLHHPSIVELHDRLTEICDSREQEARAIYCFVRDEVRHSLDAGDRAVTLTASEVLEHRTGLCYAKSHLAAALMRRSGIPTGFCYQLLAGDDGPVLHGLLAIHLDGCWHRLDVRGNKPGVDAQFSLIDERLAYCGEGVTDLPGIHSAPAASVTKTLGRATDLTQVVLPSAL